MFQFTLFFFTLFESLRYITFRKNTKHFNFIDMFGLHTIPRLKKLK